MGTGQVVVAGAGVAGLTSALFLAQGGYDVVLLERDVTPFPVDPHAAFEWDRRGAPQVRHSHAFLARVRNLMRDHLPEVLGDLIDAGASEIRWGDVAPETLDDRSPRPGDEDLVMLACRRTTFEWVLRRAALRTDHVELRDGQTVTGVISDGGAIPRITGVRTAHGSVDADVVVDAGGRRSPMRRFLADVGVDVPEVDSDTGIVYLSRFYRLLPGVVEPDPQPLNGGDLGYLKFAVFRGDNRTFSVTLAVAADDMELRSPLLRAAQFERAGRELPAIRPWTDPDVSEPITDVHVMAGLINRVRRVVVDGEPRVLGLHSVGDSAVCTNPLYGRGCSLGAVHARLLADALAAHGEDDAAVAQAFAAATERELIPWYDASVAQDAASRAAASGSVPSGAGLDLRSILAEGLFPLLAVDASANRSWMRMMNLLTPPNALLADEELMTKVMTSWQARDTRPPVPPAGPPRAEMLAVLAGAAG